MSPAPLLQAIVQGLYHIEVTRYTQLACTSIIVYDHLLTFEEEVDLIWKASWSMGKMLFLINRYYSLASVAFNNYGFFSPTLSPSWQGWTGLIACMLAEIILQMRLYAMYSLNKIVLAIMVISFLASTATSGWIMHSVLAKISAKSINIPNGMFCMPTGVSDNFYTFWIPMLAFECLLCTLALIRGFQAFVSDGSLFRTGRHLVRILLRDSVAYFLVICATYMTCLLVWIVGPTSLLEVPIGFSVAMSCVLANRIILNVREINRDLELSKIPTNNNQRSRGNGPATDSDIMEYYYDQAATVSFGNHGTLTQFEMNQRPIDWQPVHIVPRPIAPEPEDEPELLESPLDDDSDVDVPHDLPFKVL